MMMHKITPSVMLKCLNTKLDKPTNKNSLKSPKLLSQRIIKMFSSSLNVNLTNVKSANKIQLCLYFMCTKRQKTRLKVQCYYKSILITNKTLEWNQISLEKGNLNVFFYGKLTFDIHLICSF